jgi:hypothetical protein
MKFDYWLKRQNIDYETIIKQNNLNSYLDLVVYSKSLGLSPPEELEVLSFFKKDKSRNITKEETGKDKYKNNIKKSRKSSSKTKKQTSVNTRSKE